MEQFEYNNINIGYSQIGHGPEVILCFHGFGRNSDDFNIFAPLLSPGQRIVSINLFGHRNSYFPSERIENDPLTKEEWKSLLLHFIRHINIENFHLAGYSMGGRVCLVTLEILPELVKSVLLIAPDGLKVNLLYRFASETKLGRIIYRNVINNPNWVFKIAWLLNKLGLLSDKLRRFVHVSLDTKEKRWLVHDVWLIYKKLFPDLRQVGKIIADKNAPFNMIFGEFDAVITPRLGRKFCRIIGSEEHMHVIHAGHKLINEETVKYIRQNHLWPK